jgi:hypothetical protein
MTGNSASVVRMVKVIDTILPVIQLNGQDTTIHLVGTAYTDAGVTLTDNYYPETELRKNLTVNGSVNDQATGFYTITYTLKNPHSEDMLTATRVVWVKDTLAPAISMNGAPMIVMDVNTEFVNPGAVVNDNYDKNLSYNTSGSLYAEFSNGIPTRLDTFDVIYTVSDLSGNEASVRRIVVVEDRMTPVITLKGEPGARICRWENYTDAGYDLSDNFYQATDISVTTEGSFLTDSTKITGTSYLRYKAVDASGNISYSGWRAIEVRNPYEFPCATATGMSPDAALNKLVNVYPNPNQGKFIVETNLPATEQVRISVTNLLGKEVAVISNGALNQNTFSVDISNQKAGVYMLNITTSTQTLTKRIVVTK